MKKPKVIPVDTPETEIFTQFREHGPVTAVCMKLIFEHADGTVEVRALKSNEDKPFEHWHISEMASSLSYTLMQYEEYQKGYGNDPRGEDDGGNDPGGSDDETATAV